MSRRQAAPKPEELIQKLDEKFETFKTEIFANLEEKAAEINKLQENQNEEKQKIEDTLNDIREEIIKQKNEVSTSQSMIMEEQKNSISEVRDELQTILRKSVAELNENLQNRIENLSQTVASESSSAAGTQGQIHEILERVDELNEKLYDFEVNKRNNLIFYGIPGEHRETPSVLINKALTLET